MVCHNGECKEMECKNGVCHERKTSLKDQLKNNNIFLRNQKFNSRVILKASQKNNSNKFLKKLSKASKPVEEMKVMSL